MSETRVYMDNPYDLETFLEALKISRDQEKEMRFLDLALSYLRLDPTIELADASYTALTKLKLIETQTTIPIY